MPDWDAVLTVYFDWQTLNASMIALGAGLMVFTATQLDAIERTAIARRVAQARLPKALSSLWEYFDNSIEFFGEVYQRAEEATGIVRIEPKLALPDPTSEHEEIFAENLGVAPENVCWQLQMVMSELQIFEVNARKTEEMLAKGVPKYIALHACKRLADLAIIKARVGRLFGYGRLEAAFNSAAFTESDLKEQLALVLPTVSDLPKLLAALPGAAKKANSEKPYETRKTAEPKQ